MGENFAKPGACYLWINASAAITGNSVREHAAVSFVVTTGTTLKIETTDHMARDYALPVRCVRE